MITRFEVKDYEVWKQSFEAAGPQRKKAGFRTGSFYRDVDEPGLVVGLLEWDSMKNARHYVQNMELKAKMMDAGVVGVPEFHFVQAA